MAIPDWFKALAEVLSKSPKSTIYTVATVDASATLPVPRVRSIVHREFLSPSENLPLLVSTTDIRTPKIRELLSISGGPNAEIVWWLSDASEQYRFSGIIHILPRPDHELFPKFPGKRLAPEKDENGASFDWETERLRVFNEKMGPALRASFCRPTPGSKIGSYDEGDAWPTKLPKTYEVLNEDEKVKAEVAQAVNNFSLMVLEPVRVERVELAVIPNRRTQYQKEGNQWKETIVVP